MTLSELERRCIEDALRAPVFNRYGCEELSIIASESASHSGLHVFSEGLILEYLPTEVPGEYELVITDLWNRAMPMIRYAIGDVVRKADGPCPSGRGLERLERVSGRTADFLYRPDGTPVFGISLLDTYIIHIPGIRQAQIVQNELRRIDVYVVPTAEFGPDTTTAIQQVIAREFGPDVQVNVSRVSQLQQTERGKYRFSICNIPRPRDAATTNRAATERRCVSVAGAARNQPDSTFQLVVSTAAGDHATIHQIDYIALANRGQAMSDENDGLLA